MKEQEEKERKTISCNAMEEDDDDHSTETIDE